MSGQTLLGLDFGTRFVGIAVGDTETRTAHPLFKAFVKACLRKK